MKGIRCMGGFVGTDAVQAWWIEVKVEGWRYLVDIMAGVACKHPYSAYAGIQKSLHQGRAFFQRVTPNIGKAFQTVKHALQEAFLTALFRGVTFQIPGILVTGMPVK